MPDVIVRKPLTVIKKKLEEMTDYFQEQLELEKNKGNKEHAQVCVETIGLIRDMKTVIANITVLQNKEGLQ